MQQSIQDKSIDAFRVYTSPPSHRFSYLSLTVVSISSFFACATSMTPSNNLLLFLLSVLYSVLYYLFSIPVTLAFGEYYIKWTIQYVTCWDWVFHSVSRDTSESLHVSTHVWISGSFLLNSLPYVNFKEIITVFQSGHAILFLHHEFISYLSFLFLQWDFLFIHSLKLYNFFNNLILFSSNSLSIFVIATLILLLAKCLGHGSIDFLNYGSHFFLTYLVIFIISWTLWVILSFSEKW